MLSIISMLSGPNDESPANVEAAVSVSALIRFVCKWRAGLGHECFCVFVERVAREERRVQEESEPLCQKVSRNVVINFRLHTFEISLEFHPSSSNSLSETFQNCPDTTCYNPVYIVLLRSRTRAFWKVLFLRNWQS